MKSKLFLAAAMTAIMAHATGMAQATYYVSPGGNGGGGLDWETAFTQIQYAIDVAEHGDEIIVDKGVYLPIVSTNVALTIRSEHGPDDTIIDAQTKTRCATLWWGSDAYTILDGFTLRNGVATSSTMPDSVFYNFGGGALGGTLLNCVLTNNTAGCGGGAYDGKLFNCTLAGNTAYGGDGGGAAFCELFDCTLTGNTAGYGGGAYGGTLVNCTLSGNTATDDGGGAAGCWWLENCTLTGNTAECGGGAYRCEMVVNCTLSGNTAAYEGGGAIDCWLENCTLSGNTAEYGGGVSGCQLISCLLADNSAGETGGGAYYGDLINCTLSGNTAAARTGAGGADNCWLENCIVWGNIATGNVYSNHFGCSFAYSCTAPHPGPQDCIAQDPLFMDAANGDFRLLSHSPCVDQGKGPLLLDFLGITDLDGLTDLDGNPRLQGLDVDMGAYERGTATIYYVDDNRPDDSGNGQSWGTAKKTIRGAIVMPGAEQIIVTNGVYEAFTSPNLAVTIRSVNGAAVTVIDGGHTNRCATLASPHGIATILTGFTLRNGFAGHPNVTIANSSGGGSWQGTLNNCVLTNNTALYGGGSAGGILNNCVLTDNDAEFEGGGALGGTLNSCLLTHNKTGWAGGGTFDSDLNNCTLSGNTADRGGGSVNGFLNNCIVWGNTATYGDEQEQNYLGGEFAYSCTAPLPDGPGNISADPLFENALNDFRLQTDSPCFNAGNNDFVASVFDLDLDGKPRIIHGTVDMGAYEYGIVTVFYVDITRPDDSGYGDCWATAKKTIQAAIDMPTALEVVVTNGVYAPIFTTNKTVALLIHSVEGAEHTIIDGGGSKRCALLGVNTNRFYTLLDGFTLRNGYADGGDGGGGAFYGTLSNCVLTNNTARFNGGGAERALLLNCTLTGNTAEWHGGGTVDCELHNCTLTGNTAKTHCGGGAHTSILKNCLLTGNTAYDDGGGAYGGTLTDCTLTGNTAKDGGGSASGTLTNCTLSDNTATRNGGGAYGGTLINCTLTGNTAKDGGGAWGGGVYSGTFINCALTGNTATQNGGGAYGGTLLNCTLKGNTANQNGGGAYENNLLVNCLLTGNAAQQRGGGAYGGMLLNCTLSGNNKTGLGGGGGGVYYSTLYNSIVWGNSTLSGNAVASSLNFTCVEQYMGSGSGIIGQNPLFVDAPNGNFRLQPNSPCIDAGFDWMVMGAVDLDGNPRIYGNAVDMGAYEFAPEFSVTFNGNGGDPAIQSIPQRTGNAYVLPDPGPARAVHTFLGWYTAASGGTQVTDSTLVTQTTAHTLWARWKQTHTQTTPVPVPHDWLDDYFPGLETDQDYEDAANGKGADGIHDVWEYYVAGCDPTDPDDWLRIIVFTVEDGDRVTDLQWAPDLRPDRVYTIWGMTNLTDTTGWYTPTNSATRFFKVSVEMP